MAPGYLAELCGSVSSINGHRHLRSARRGQLDVPRVTLSTYGGRVLCHAGPSAWNALPVCLKNDANNALSLSNFRNQLRRFYFTPRAFDVVLQSTRYINCLLTYFELIVTVSSFTLHLEAYQSQLKLCTLKQLHKHTTLHKIID